MYGKYLEEEDDDDLDVENKVVEAQESPMRRIDMLRGLEYGSLWRFAVIAFSFVAVNNLKMYALLLIDPGMLSKLIVFCFFFFKQQIRFLHNIE